MPTVQDPPPGRGYCCNIVGSQVAGCNSAIRTRGTRFGADPLASKHWPQRCWKELHIDEQDEATLIQGLRSGHKEAFQLAVTHYSGSMLATAKAIAGPSNAEDIVQDVWLTVFEQIKSFEHRASLKTWLQRIVANTAISHLRSLSREVSRIDRDNDASDSDWFDPDGSWALPPTLWHTDSPESLLAAQELQNCIDKHLLEMPDSQRGVLVLRDMQQMNFAEICNELDLSASNARVLLHRGRMRLVKMINHFEETGSC